MRRLSTELLSTYLFNVFVISIIVNIAVSLYGIFARPSLIKKIIAVTILGDSVNTLAIIVGYRMWPNPYQPVIPPILTKWNPTPQDIQNFAYLAVDPLPQALVLTAIVIGLAVTLYLVFLTLQIYRFYKTTDVRKIAKLKG